MTNEDLVYDQTTPEPLTITFLTNPKWKVTGKGYLSWLMRKRISQLNEGGGFEGHMDAILKVWLPDEETSWNVHYREKNGAIVLMPRTAEVIDGETQPHLQPEDTNHIGLELGKRFFPTLYFGFMIDDEGNLSPSGEPTEDEEQKPKRKPRPTKQTSASD